jgi:hypothetical protein
VLGGSDCEQIGTGWLAQPVNALSSLAFVPAGLWVASRAGERHGWRRWETLGVGAALVANGVGSFAYHGTQPPWAQVAHDAPIVAIVALLAANELGRRARPAPAPEPAGRRAGRIALATGAAALAAYALGRTGSPACRPESLLQWHAAWHGLAAVSLAAAAAARIERG